MNRLDFATLEERIDSLLPEFRPCARAEVGVLFACDGDLSSEIAPSYEGLPGATIR
jgi:hypothetical protein